MKEFFFFLAELDAPFIDIPLRSTRMDLDEPGWLLNTEKGYKVRIYGLYTIILALKIKLEIDENKEAYVKFDDVTKAIIFRAINREKDRLNINTIATSTSGISDGSKKRNMEKKKKESVLNIWKKQGTQGDVDVDRLMIKHLAAIIL